MSELRAAFYLDTSAVLRAVLETGLSPEIEARLQNAEALVTSRLSLVESARALLRARRLAGVTEERLASARRDVDAIWARCDLFELTPAICEAACRVAPDRALRALDALHVATFLAARRRIDGLELLTADDRLREAAAEA